MTLGYLLINYFRKKIIKNENVADFFGNFFNFYKMFSKMNV